MEVAQSRVPRKVTAATRFDCAYCGKAAYEEVIVGELQADGTYAYRREGRGAFKQQTDDRGAPTGPIVPMCNCKD
jgi:hypothetical protein